MSDPRPPGPPAPQPTHLAERGAWWERLDALFSLVGQVHTFAVGPGLARIHRPGQWSLGELVFGAEHRLWYVRSEAASPSLGVLLREHYAGRADPIEEVARSAAGDGMRLGRALVEKGVFSESEIIRVLRVQAAHGLLDIVARLNDDDIDVAWTPLADGAARLPAPTLDEAYLAAAHRVVVATDVGPRLEQLCGLRRLGLAGEVLARSRPNQPFLPVRTFGVTGGARNLYRLSHDVTVAANTGPRLRVITPAGSTLPHILVVEHDRAALCRSVRGQPLDEILPAVDEVLLARFPGRGLDRSLDRSEADGEPVP